MNIEGESEKFANFSHTANAFLERHPLVAGFREHWRRSNQDKIATHRVSKSEVVLALSALAVLTAFDELRGK